MRDAYICVCNSMRSYYRPIQTKEKCNLYVLKEIERKRAKCEEKTVKYRCCCCCCIFGFSVYIKHDKKTEQHDFQSQSLCDFTFWNKSNGFFSGQQATKTTKMEWKHFFSEVKKHVLPLLLVCLKSVVLLLQLMDWNYYVCVHWKW